VLVQAKGGERRGKEGKDRERERERGCARCEKREKTGMGGKERKTD
jgi:hypothetical protein